MKNNNLSNELASSMENILNSDEFKKVFNPYGIEKLASLEITEEPMTEVELELEAKLEPALEVEASENPKADCVMCAKKRQGWDSSMGVCNCSVKNGCDLMNGCKPNCSCGCKMKQASDNNDILVKSAFNALMKASTDLEDAGFESLAADTLVLLNGLVKEAKAKKSKKDESKEEKKAKEKALKEKLKEKADKLKAKEEKDKNEAKDKAMKEKAKVKAKLEKEKEEKAKLEEKKKDKK